MSNLKNNFTVSAVEFNKFTEGPKPIHNDLLENGPKKLDTEYIMNKLTKMAD